ncbi:14641_t:CDS:1, partial [Funneliformis geosporum]
TNKQNEPKEKSKGREAKEAKSNDTERRESDNEKYSPERSSCTPFNNKNIIKE